jgi:hypothetical protein
VVYLGTHIETGEGVELSDEARRQGVYLIGTTGTGKTTLLQNIIYQDMVSPNRPGLCVLDPHGDFIDALLERVPDGSRGTVDRRDDVIVFDPGAPEQFDYPLGLNLLECNRRDPKQVYRVTSTVIDTLYKLFSWSWGPRMEDLLRHALLTLMETPDTTLLELLLLLVSKEHRARFTEQLSDPVLEHYWKLQFGTYDKRQVVEVVGSSLNKIGRFLANPLMRNIVSQPKSAFSMRQVMDEGKILLVNLSKGDLGEDNSALLGAVMVNMVLIAALQRREISPAQRRPFHLFVDEYQNFATQSFPTLQSEARKYGITVTVAHQYRDQLDLLNRGATLNVANLIVMRVTGSDAYELAPQFDNTPPPPEQHFEPVYKVERVDEATGQPFYTPTKLTSSGKTLHQQVERRTRQYSDMVAETANVLSIQRNYHAKCRIMTRTGLTECVIATQEPLGNPKPVNAAYIRRRSQSLGKPRSEVEADIAYRMRGLRFDEVPFGVEA